MDLKTKIKDQKGFEVESQKIVFKGKATTNTDELDKLGVKEGDFLVVMTTVKVTSNPNPRNPNIKRSKNPNNNPSKWKLKNLNLQSNKNPLNPNLNPNHNLNSKIKPAKPTLLNSCQWDSPETKLSRH